MDLGKLVNRLENEQDAGEALAAIGDLALYAAVRSIGERFGENPAVYAAGAVARFAGGAGDDDWVSLLGTMERSQEPGHAFLVHAIRWAIARDTHHANQTTCCGSCSSGSEPEPHHGTDT